MLTVALAVLFAPLLADSCLPPVVECHPTQYDLNCDGTDFLHCAAYDLDGEAYGDCLPDEEIDDFWTFYDGDFDGLVECDNPKDFVIELPDGKADGTYDNPACDKYSQDFYQGSDPGVPLIIFLDWDTIGVAADTLGEFDLVRGVVANLSEGSGTVDLGPVDCLADNEAGSGYVQVSDYDEPAPGDAFFYAARWTGGTLCSACVYPYGYGGCLERIVPQEDGDCNLVLVSVSADPETLPPGGGSSDISALVTDQYGTPLAGIDVIFHTTKGSLASGGAAVSSGPDGTAADVLTTTESAYVSALTLVDNPRAVVRVTVASP